MRQWTPEQRARQAEAIRKWKPWNKSTGPKTLALSSPASEAAMAAERRTGTRHKNVHSNAVHAVNCQTPAAVYPGESRGGGDKHGK